MTPKNLSPEEVYSNLNRHISRFKFQDHNYEDYYDYRTAPTPKRVLREYFGANAEQIVLDVADARRYLAISDAYMPDNPFAHNIWFELRELKRAIRIAGMKRNFQQFWRPM